MLERLRERKSLTEYREWEEYARPEQLPPPGDWRVWLILAGRGWGKTRAEVEWLRMQMESGRCKRMAIVGRTAADVRDVMVEGESGILEKSRPNFRPRYEPTKRRLTWPNGAIATTYSAEEPDTLRGPQHDGAIADELAAWRYPEAWDQLMFGLRIGEDPRVVVATTPRPTRIIKELLDDPKVVVTRGTTYDNIANLAPAFVEKIVARYEGTRLGRQELLAEVLSDVPGALWQLSQIDALRVTAAPPLTRIVVAIDPAASSGDEASETGIIAAGLADNGHAYVLEDRTVRASPGEWARRAVAAYHRLRADRIIGEVNNGGEMVGHTIMMVDPTVSYKAVHASRGKLTRAEPIAALYEQGRVHHVGTFPELEDQMTMWVPGDPSPDRMDALVWALTELVLENTQGPLAILI